MQQIGHLLGAWASGIAIGVVVVLVVSFVLVWARQHYGGALGSERSVQCQSSSWTPWSGSGAR